MNTKEKHLRPMSEHPEAGTVVRFEYKLKKDGVSAYFAKWDGEKWLIRRPYSVDEWEDMNIPMEDIIGWSEK